MLRVLPWDKDEKIDRKMSCGNALTGKKIENIYNQAAAFWKYCLCFCSFQVGVRLSNVFCTTIGGGFSNLIWISGSFFFGLWAGGGMIPLLVMVAKKPAAKLNFPELILEPATAKD